jgi:hypothetical protein
MVGDDLTFAGRESDTSLPDGELVFKLQAPVPHKTSNMTSVFKIADPGFIINLYTVQRRAHPCPRLA